MGKSYKYDVEKSFQVIAVRSKSNSLSDAIAAIQNAGPANGRVEIHIDGQETISLSIPAEGIVEILDILDMMIGPD